MGRIVENVSFGLDVLTQEAERSAAERQKERIARLLAALGATNEAIMRRNDPRGDVPAGMRGRRQGRQVHLHGHWAGAAPTDDF